MILGLNKLSLITCRIGPLSFTSQSTMFRGESLSASKMRNSSVPDNARSGPANHINEALKRYTFCKTEIPQRGSGVSIVWFRNDLRILDNEALFRAWQSSEAVLPVYCIDPRIFNGSTHYFGFPKTGSLRAKFILESIADLRRNLLNKGVNLLIKYGKPEDVIIQVSKSFGAHTIYAHKETCSEEVRVERNMMKNLENATFATDGLSEYQTFCPKLHLVWGSTLYHLNDLPFKPECLPDVYTNFRKAVESMCAVRPCYKLPSSLGPLPHGITENFDWGKLPTVGELGLATPFQCNLGVMQFIGGEDSGLARIHEYFWEKDLLKHYKDTRNGMLGADYSSKLSPWLASGSLSARYIYEEVKQYEKARTANSSTYWILFELMWRDYFRFVSIKYGNSMFHQEDWWLAYGRDVPTLQQLTIRILTQPCSASSCIPHGLNSKRYVANVIRSTDPQVFNYGQKTDRVKNGEMLKGPRRVNSLKWNQDPVLFKFWQDGQTGYPLVDANMKELKATGFMSNRGRQIVCSFLVRDMGFDWRMGAEWFETCLLDYDPCSNYGNWTYGAGVGNDPREDRYFSIPKQAKSYDPEGRYVAHWLPEIAKLPKEIRHSPGKAYIQPVVPLKYSSKGYNYDVSKERATKIRHHKIKPQNNK